jgi:hypothetical protein
MKRHARDAIAGFLQMTESVRHSVSRKTVARRNDGDRGDGEHIGTDNRHRDRAGTVTKFFAIDDGFVSERWSGSNGRSTSIMTMISNTIVSKPQRRPANSIPRIRTISFTVPGFGR